VNVRPSDWPLLRQLRSDDHLGRGTAVRSRATEAITARTETADAVVDSICPYCAVGCAQKVYVKDGRAVQIEGDPDSPVSRGRLCPKGSATLQLTTGDAREHQVLYRRPHGTDWEPLDLDTAMDMVVDRLLAARADGWEWDHDGMRVRRTMGVASLGGATLDNEENYLLKKLFTALGVIQVENQARVCHSSTVVGLGTSFGRGGATTFPGDLPNADLILLEGSNMAEAHPVAFQWVVEAKARGAKVVHIDPHFSRTSALADLFVPLRAGTDIAFLGGIINHVLTEGKDFREYVLAYTNASTILREDFVDTEDLDGVFSGFDPETGTYAYESWQYEGTDVAAASGNRERPPRGDEDGNDDPGGAEGSGDPVRHAAAGESAGAGGHRVGGIPQRDPTLQHPRCVFNVLKRHYARYTPEVVERECGIPQDLFAQVCDLVTANSGRERTMAFVYGVGWTQHTIGSQYIRAASVLQLLLGNIGRKGGGIMAMRGHASIQGSSDIPTLFDLLPGYIPMPHAQEHLDLDSFISSSAAEQGFWGNMRSYVVSLLKAWWGDAATAENDFCFDYLPRLTGAHGTYSTVVGQLEGRVKGYFLMGENPAVGSANNRMQRLGMANLDWLVVRDFSLIESATWWKDGPEIESGELRTQDIGTEVFFFPAASHTEKDGTFTNTQRLVQWHHRAVEPTGDQRSDLWFAYHLGRRLRERLADSTDDADRPLLDLTWSYPTEGPLAEPSADAVLREINGSGPDGHTLPGYTELKDDGSTTSGCWLYCGVYADDTNQAARRTPKEQQNWTGGEWAWAWPANRRVLYNRASSDPDGKPWSERKALVWWDPEKGDAGEWTGHDVPDFELTKPPDYRPPEGASGPDAIAGDEPFIMQADGRGWLYAPAGLADGPLPTHYEAQDSPFTNGLYGGHDRNPARQLIDHPLNPYHPSGDQPGADVFPFVVTTYRLTEHFTAGGMSRWLPYLSELQPEAFFEVSPELAALRGLEHAGWATMVSARGAIEGRVMVTRRMATLTVQGRELHQIGVPYHWGPNGLATGDSFNELLSIAMDPSAHIQEDKALSADIVPGRRPRGPGRMALVEQYRRRAGITTATGMER
jgi:formate dehydrogenase major subunit